MNGCQWRTLLIHLYGVKINATYTCKIIEVVQRKTSLVEKIYVLFANQNKEYSPPLCTSCIIFWHCFNMEMENTVSTNSRDCNAK